MGIQRFVAYVISDLLNHFRCQMVFHTDSYASFNKFYQLIFVFPTGISLDDTIYFACSDTGIFPLFVNSGLSLGVFI